MQEDITLTIKQEALSMNQRLKQTQKSGLGKHAARQPLIEGTVKLLKGAEYEDPHHRLTELTNMQNEKQKDITKLQRYVQDIETQIVRIVKCLTRKFEKRLFAVGAEMILIKPVDVSNPNTMGMNLQIVLDKQQYDYFVKKFMEVGISRKDAKRTIESIIWRFKTATLFSIEQYFDVTLPDRLADKVNREGNFCFGKGISPRKYQVMLTKSDVIYEHNRFTLTEDAKQKLRLNMLTAVALDIPSPCSSELLYVRKALENRLGVFVQDYRVNCCKGDMKC